MRGSNLGGVCRWVELFRLTRMRGEKGTWRLHGQFAAARRCGGLGLIPCSSHMRGRAGEEKELQFTVYIQGGERMPLLVAGRFLLGVPESLKTI